MAYIRQYAWHYPPPTNREFKLLLDRWGLNNQQAAMMTDTTAKTISRYVNDDVSYCPFPVLYVLAMENEGIQISKDEWRKELKL